MTKAFPNSVIFDAAPTLEALVGDLISTGAPPDYKIVSRRFDFFGGEPPSFGANEK